MKLDEWLAIVVWRFSAIVVWIAILFLCPQYPFVVNPFVSAELLERPASTVLAELADLVFIIIS